MSEGRRLASMIVNAAKPGDGVLTDIVVGEVVAISPLKVRISDNVVLSETFLYKSILVEEKIIKVPVITTTEESSHTHNIPNAGDYLEIKLWRGLELGDTVRMLKCYSGQKYYIIERLEE